MARKVIIDCDPGIDDAVALCLALFEPRLEIIAITATAGNVLAEQASRNVQAVVEQLDPPRFPRLGAANDGYIPAADARLIHGADGLGNAEFRVSQLHHPHPSEKLICDAVRSAPDEVTIIALGPLTNIAGAFQRDPELVSMVDRIIMMGGSVSCKGNVTPAAEFNMYCDPISAGSVPFADHEDVDPAGCYKSGDFNARLNRSFSPRVDPRRRVPAPYRSVHIPFIPKIGVGGSALARRSGPDCSLAPGIVRDDGYGW